MELSSIPSVDKLLSVEQVKTLVNFYGRPLVVETIRDILDDVRKEFPATGNIPDDSVIIGKVEARLRQLVKPTLFPVINATGVIIHTNLGRAPLSEEAIEAAREVSLGYSNLEFDLQKGKRGSRLLHAEQLLCRLTGAEAAMVVNNNAAAVLLILTGLARKRKVAIARSQLVEIGGGFRIPEVMKQSGARLVEVGTTNRIHLSDYRTAIEADGVRLVMRAHRSNFAIIGFTTEPSLREICQLAHQYDLPVVDDLGSGSILPTENFGLGHEPMVQESLVAGADLVCFSGDKLLGGPQAGIIVGKQKYIGKLKKHPLARALRTDKVTLAALSATLLHYLKDEAVEKIPVWRMISTPLKELEMRAIRWQEAIGTGEVISAFSTVGGGSLPGETLPTYVLALKVAKPSNIMAKLRHHAPPIIARVEKDQVLLDPRTILPQQDETLLDGLRAALAGEKL